MLDISSNTDLRTHSPEQQFNFWLGNWNLTWADSGVGTNRVSTILDNHVIQEEFDAHPSGTLRGLSVSVYVPQIGKWKQTWVDSDGSYLDFVGEFADGKMELRRSATAADGRVISQRMVWYNIEPNELDWNWERSEDEGQTWQVQWHIHYRRQL